MQGSGVYERRTTAEWELLKELVALNPERLCGLEGQDSQFSLTVAHTPALLVDGEIGAEHRIRIDFPVHYPAVPMTLHLQRPVVHPNIHPTTGFVCLWLEHRVSNNVEHALHKLVDMLQGVLWNTSAEHLMQADAVTRMRTGDGGSAPPRLQGLQRPESFELPQPASRRRRLS